MLPGAVDVHVHTRSAPEEGIEALHARGRGRGRHDDRRHALRRRRADPDAGGLRGEGRRRRARGARRRGAVGDGAAARADRARRRRSSQAGAAAFKLSTFETHPERFPRIPDGQLLAPSSAIAAAGGLAGVHAENDEIVRAGIEAERAAGNGGDPLAHARSRPPVAEHEAVARCLEFAASHRRAPARLPPLDAAAASRSSLAARAGGVDVSAESCPHYLLLDESELARRGGEAKINPPLRARPLGLRGIDIVASDHVGWPVERKRGDDIFALASGAPGVELIVPLDPRRVRAARRSRGCCASGRPAASACGRARARILPGADADLLVLDPDARVGGRPGGARHARRLEPLRRPAPARPRDRRLLARRADLGRRPRRAPRRHGRFVPATRARGASGGGPMSDGALRCRGWRQEAILRLLENNLAIAERPEDLVVYAAHAKAARDHDSLRRIVRELTALEDGQTLVDPVRQADRRPADRAALAGGAARQRQPRRPLGDARELLRPRAPRADRPGAG